jgi:hypothetical protein
MNEQEAFDRSVGGVLKQGGPSAVYKIDGGTRAVCLYRGPNGRRCAAGHLIDDADYREEFEGSAYFQLVTAGLLAPIVGGSALVHLLQLSHDNAATGTDCDSDFIREFEANAKKVASDFGLNWNFN